MKHYIIHEQTGEIICTIFEGPCLSSNAAYNHCIDCQLIREYTEYQLIKEAITEAILSYYESGAAYESNGEPDPIQDRLDSRDRLRTQLRKHGVTAWQYRNYLKTYK